MALETRQTLQDIANRIFISIQANLPELNPSVRESVTRALAIAMSGRFYDLYVQLDQLQTEIFPTTATQLDFIRYWGIFKGLDLDPASQASGFITSNAQSIGVVVPNGTAYSANGIDFDTIGGDSTSEDLVLHVADISRNGSVVSIETEVDHTLASNVEVIISGVDQAEYNGTFTIHVTDTNRFTYIISGSATDPTGTNVIMNATIVILKIQASETGLIGNLDPGAAVTLETSIVDINDTAYVQYTTVSGGAEEETVAEYKARVINRYQNPIAFFSAQWIINEVNSLSGNTRTWVFDIQPEPGYVSVYFVRDNTAGILPTGQDVADTTEHLLPFVPAPMQPEKLLVSAPAAKVIDFTFTSLVPNSTGMQQAIRDNLELFFKTQTDVAENISEDAYRSAIYQSLNPETGEFVKEFDLSSPHGVIEIGTGELALLGNINF